MSILKPSIESLNPWLEWPGPHIHRARQRIPIAVQWLLYRLCLLFNDVALTSLAFFLAYWLRFALRLPFFQFETLPAPDFYRRVSLILTVSWVTFFALNGLYQRRQLLGGTQEYARVFWATSVGLLLVIVAGFLDPDLILARGWLLLAWLLTFLLVGFGRFVWRRVIYALRYQGYFLTPALIVGANDEAQALAEQLMSWRTSGLYVVGLVADRHASALTSRLPASGAPQILGGLDELDALIGRLQVEELILATSALSRADIVEIFKRYGWQSDLTVHLSSGLFEIVTTGLELNELASVPLVRLNHVRLTGIDRLLKIALDYVIALPLTLLLLPLMALIALAVRLDSPGPAFYRRRVLGLHGRPFDAFKFRTMVQNGDEMLAQDPALQLELTSNHKLKADPRITRIGRILRQTSLDELPQLFNVLLGQMSLVGPRMISPPEIRMYNQWEMNLLTVCPGITGLWQVSGRSDLSYAERVRLDMHYIRNWTIWLDLYVLFLTLPAVLRRRGAY